MEEMDWALVKIKGDQVPAVATGSAGVNEKKKKNFIDRSPRELFRANELLVCGICFLYLRISE